MPENLKFGTTIGNDIEEMARLESLAIDSLWVGGHVTGPNEFSELIVNLARLSAVSSRVVVGAAALVLPLYQPAIVAKQIADLDRYTGGRIVLGVGSGGDYPEEFRACEIPLEHRGARLTEGIEVLRAFWSGKEVTHHGRFYHIDRAHIAPAPPQGSAIPIVIAGRTKAIRRAALVGDGWMPYFFSARAYAESVRQITELADQAERDLDGFHWYHYTFVLLDDDQSRARERAAGYLGAGFRGVPGQDYAPLVDKVAAVGNTATVTSRLQSYVDAGVRHFILVPLTGGQERAEMLNRLLDEVAPNLG
jgi:alkanesulfonate monooxygenase SsuD/methylene tetrahydromethanopterin reductase-like flavin-dependent oxidoreductase (luciferase family)